MKKQYEKTIRQQYETREKQEVVKKEIGDERKTKSQRT